METTNREGVSGVQLSRRQEDFRIIKRNWQLYLLLLIPVAYFIIFKYAPMVGNILAFRRYRPGGSIFGAEWVGFRYFEAFIGDPQFWKVFTNTLSISFMNLIIGFPMPLIFTLLLNEVRFVSVKKFVQTVSYLPRFFSTVIVVSFIKILLSPSTGVLNAVIERFGGEAIHFLNMSEYFRWIYVFSEIWQYLGWSAIIYIAALSGIDPQLYEAAKIDGANRLQQAWHITLAGLMPAVIINLTLSVGRILTLGFEKILLLYSPSIYDTADVIQTYVYRIGLLNNNFSLATAMGLFQGVISLFLLWSTNKAANKITGYGLW